MADRENRRVSQIVHEAVNTYLAQRREPKAVTLIDRQRPGGFLSFVSVSAPMAWTASLPSTVQAEGLGHVKTLA